MTPPRLPNGKFKKKEEIVQVDLPKIIEEINKEKRKENNSSTSWTPEMEKYYSKKDPLAILDYNPNQLNSFEKAFHGWFFVGVLLIPIVLLGALIYYFKSWFEQNWFNLLNGVALLSLFIGFGNIMYDVGSKTGWLRKTVSLLKSDKTRIKEGIEKEKQNKNE